MALMDPEVADSPRDRTDEPLRRRRRTTAIELDILEAEFAQCDKPSIADRDR